MLARSTRWFAPTLVTLAAAIGLAGCERRAEPAVACTPEARDANAEPISSAAVDSPTPAGVAAPGAAAAPPAASMSGAVAAKPARAPEAAEPQATRLRIKRLVVAEGVDAREPIGPRSAFVAGDMDKVYAFVELDNPERLGGAITVSFEPPNGPEIGKVNLTVGASPRWRTWAFSRGVREVGEWNAIVRDDSGRILAREPFSITL